MEAYRSLLVVADDFGIGPATSHGILDLAERGRISATVLLVNSPHADRAVRDWRRSGIPLEIGWHPCLTLDGPVLPSQYVPSLVGNDGRFLNLGRFLRRLFLGFVRYVEVQAELQAQYERFIELIGRPPHLVNAHHHLHIFAPVGEALLEILGSQTPAPYFRRVVEPWPTLHHVSGRRMTRAVLSNFGRRFARRQGQAGFPGNDFLAGLTNAERFNTWLTHVPGRTVEWVCHPGFPDPTLYRRADAERELIRRPRELYFLQQTDFIDACRRTGFALATVSEIIGSEARGLCHAA